jgi:acyl-CoA thioester hydrolase
MYEHIIQVRVRYAETDQMDIVYYGNYAQYFEVGRTESIRDLGFTYKEMEAMGVRMPVVELKVRYLRPAHYDEVLRIRTCVVESRSRTIRFGYEILNDATGELLATGETLHVICDGEGRPKSLPAKYRKYFPLTRSREPDPAMATRAEHE